MKVLCIVFSALENKLITGMFLIFYGVDRMTKHTSLPLDETFAIVTPPITSLSVIFTFLFSLNFITQWFWCFYYSLQIKKKNFQSWCIYEDTIVCSCSTAVCACSNSYYGIIEPGCNLCNDWLEIYPSSCLC